MNPHLCGDFYWREFAAALRAMAGVAALLAAFGGAALTLPASATAEQGLACAASCPAAASAPQP